MSEFNTKNPNDPNVILKTRKIKTTSKIDLASYEERVIDPDSISGLQ